MADWADLPYELLSIITNRVNTVEDYLAFSVVCRSWHDVYLNKDWKPIHPLLPRLMLSENLMTTERRFFSVSRNRISAVDLPEAQGKRCWGSPHGWLVTLGLDLKMELLNPITKVTIQLPPLDTLEVRPHDKKLTENWQWFRSSFIYKAILLKTSHGAKNEDFLVAVIYGSNFDLAFAEPGCGGWASAMYCEGFIPRDVILYNNQIFSINKKGNLIMLEDHPPQVKLPRLPRYESNDMKAITDSENHQQTYLVDSFGDLLAVLRCVKRNSRPATFTETLSFAVYKLDFAKSGWERINELGDRAIFVGDSCSCAVRASDFRYCRANAVYFTDDKMREWYEFELGHGAGRDIGVYDMKSGKIKPFKFDYEYPSHYFYPVWIG